MQDGGQTHRLECVQARETAAAGRPNLRSSLLDDEHLELALAVADFDAADDP